MGLADPKAGADATSRSPDLQALLAEAAAASPAQRIEYRDPIAAYGVDAVNAVAPWLANPGLGAFAVRVIGKAAALGAEPAAVDALRAATKNALPESVRRDVDAELARLKPRASRSAAARPRPTKAAPQPTRSLGDLLVGRTYARRRDLHEHGLGGNWQKGISYPETGDYALLFSDPARESDYGYKDSWLGSDRYRYFGEWSGTGDMTMTAGNAAIRDRSPELHLFVAAPGGHRYEGRFAYERHELERTAREGREFTAIVFLLARVGRG